MKQHISKYQLNAQTMPVHMRKRVELIKKHTKLCLIDIFEKNKAKKFNQY